MARGEEHRRDDDEEEDKDKDATISDDALDLIDEDDEDDPLMAEDPEDEKGWE